MDEADEQIETETPAPSMLPIYRSDVIDMPESTRPWRRNDEGVVDEGEESRYVSSLQVLCLPCFWLLMNTQHAFSLY